MSDGDDLTARFARQGLTVVGAVPVFTGLYPLLGGWGNWEALFTRHRLLARTADGIQEWTAWTGPTPGRLVREDKRTGVELVVGRGRYDQVMVGGRRFWVHRRHRQTVQDWATPGSAGGASDSDA